VPSAADRAGDPRRPPRPERLLLRLRAASDSTVAFTLCLKAWGRTGSRAVCRHRTVREGETEFVTGVFESLGQGIFAVEHAEERFLGALQGSPIRRKSATSSAEAFVGVQQDDPGVGHYSQTATGLARPIDTIESRNGEAI